MIFLKYIFIGLLAGILNGLFGSGGGTIIVPALTGLFNIEQYKAHATAIAIILPITIASSIMYTHDRYVNFGLAAYVAVGGIVGGIIGAVILKKVPSRILRIVFGSFMLLAAIRMVI